MKEKSNAIRGVLTAMGIGPEHVEAALTAIVGPRQEPRHNDEALMTPSQLRARLSVSATTLWRMKGLPFVLVGPGGDICGQKWNNIWLSVRTSWEIKMAKITIKPTPKYRVQMFDVCLEKLLMFALFSKQVQFDSRHY